MLVIVNGFYIYKWIKFLVWNKIDKILNLGNCHSLQSYHSGWFTIFELYKNKFNCNCCWDLSLLKDICCIFKAFGWIYYLIYLSIFSISISISNSISNSIYFHLRRSSISLSHYLNLSPIPILHLTRPSPHLIIA